MRQWIPNTFTLLNLLSGSSAIYLLFSEKLLAAVICGAACLVFDLADGLAARLLKSASTLGTQLDSLADMVSFGVLPGSIAAFWWSYTCPDGSLWIGLTGMIITVTTGYRLAKFNIDTRVGDVFYGLPSPSSATVLFGLLLMEYTDHPWMAYLYCNSGVFIGLVVLLSLLLLSNIRLWSVKGLMRPAGRWILGVLLGILGVLLFAIGAAAIPVMVLVYVLFGLLNTITKSY